MHELTFTDPCVLFALRRESQPFLNEFPPHQPFPGAPARAWFCGPAWLTVLVLETGIGPERTEEALDWLLGRPVFGNVTYRPRVVLSAGFSGAIAEDLRVGDLILATEVVDLDGNRRPTTWPGDLPPGEWRPPLRRGRILTTSRLVATVAEKQVLGRQHDAVAVDMETSIVARCCARAAVPFGCLRAISDDLHTPLSPGLVDCLAGGRVAPLRLLRLLARSPRTAAELLRLARQTKVAARQLGAALGELLTLTLSWGANL